MRAILLLMLLSTLNPANPLPKEFSYVKELIPSVVEDIRYYAKDNFIGQPIDGYLAPKSILTTPATKALKKVQDELNLFGLGLKIFDAYRPQKAVDHFVRWGLDLVDTKMQEVYYPTVKKKNLFKEGYIAKRSGHSRGSTVDLTIIDLDTQEELNMGSPFDFFGKVSWVTYDNIPFAQRANRLLLHNIMLKYGFKSYPQEWWHFTLRDEPYPNRYFEFNVE